MLDRQSDSFVGGQRLTDMVLGLAGACERIVALLARPRASGPLPEGGPLADAILGLVSIRRGLWASLAVATETQGAEAPSSQREGRVQAPSGDLLR